MILDIAIYMFLFSSSCIIYRNKEFALVVAGSLTVLHHKRACFSIQRSTIVEKFTILC